MDEWAEPLLAAKGIVIALWLVAFLAAERLWPAAPRADGSGAVASAWMRRLGDPWRLGKNAALWAINAGLGPILVLPVTVFAAALGPAWRPAEWSGASALLIDLVVLDLWIYAWHRVNHEVPLLWRFHRVHHMDKFLDASSAGRFHMGEVALSAVVRGAVVAVLDVPVAHLLVFETLILAAAIFQHSNLRLPPRLERAMSWLVVTPSIHWMHHHAVRADTDSSYATILSVWDRAFGTRAVNARRPDQPIGLEGAPDPSLGALLLAPFRRD